MHGDELRLFTISRRTASRCLFTYIHELMRGSCGTAARRHALASEPCWPQRSAPAPAGVIGVYATGYL